VLELDLIGRSVTLADSDVRWIYGQAKIASGHSLGARDLATRLQGLEPEQERKQLILTRPEASALARLLDAAGGTPPGCDELMANLVELLGASHSASNPRLQGDAIA
jgi:hypothetical protein